MDLSYQDRIRYGDIVYIELNDSNNNLNVLISNNISFKSKAEVEIINVSDSNFPDYDEYLFIIFPALSDKFYTYKNDLENKLAQLKERLLNNNFDVEERNKLMKSLNDTKDEIYQQNAFTNEQIGFLLNSVKSYISFILNQKCICVLKIKALIKTRFA